MLHEACQICVISKSTQGQIIIFMHVSQLITTYVFTNQFLSIPGNWNEYFAESVLQNIDSSV